MQEDDANYYRRRAESETFLAQNAQCPKAVAAHYQLATLYFDRAEGRSEPESINHG